MRYSASFNEINILLYLKGEITLKLNGLALCFYEILLFYCQIRSKDISYHNHLLKELWID